MKIVIGCDEAAYKFKETIKQYLENKGYEVKDVGVYNEEPSLYADTAERLCKEITAGTCKRGILCCGTGIGMAITANKIPGIRAAVAHDMFSLERMIKSNDCQVLCMGARIIAPQSAELLLDRWLEIEFKDGPSTPKINRIMQIEKRYHH
ncbi:MULTISPECIES: RpiB/LacA/LacB family sugar-phosphate isomerase [Faecalicoccus]|uniref:RpiB/LacA/LacB family sugar-phosphate isomerase n=1 Tax=Faecalicoccus pleomorphus TaxID=1323 RepID=A0AAW6CTE2_9FIRM|nr:MULTISPECIES: RpiB/LacA/LacB family sugar-phosphate isomerase [Faecalicoccus]MBM6678918.1 RpiB/LacA/LacB family sugar-phosphate isomerase [Faecalicoccus pleomorphus]MBM6765500.1 RpiB/LacA/LacB family sugar-phosphate isomerase [Faecalicoccus pleomorphus]MBM6809306.1 RpiB/LacA/LacB family sugar-phosphate isomerase [Faecalicoccus pleomorphus]MDB7980262.1 RpiB/LacA/LacB family sugar-phosphate isomerase [Faecalicoccus pleomorphus]MDB7982596.1 RpiB/LacA/LacB family sugar-phosphate isomerase [Faec